MFARKLEKMIYPPEFAFKIGLKLLKKIFILLFMIIGMQFTTKAYDEVTSEDTVINFPRETYICGPSVVLNIGEKGLFIFMSPTFEGSKNIDELWERDLQDTQLIIEPLKESLENFIRIKPGVEMYPETYDFLCVDIVAYDRKEQKKLYAVDYYIYK